MAVLWHHAKLKETLKIQELTISDSLNQCQRYSVRTFGIDEALEQFTVNSADNSGHSSETTTT